LSPPTILLFDIDGTLIDAGGAGRRALEYAFEATAGSNGWLGFSLAGMTDRAIVRAALQSRKSAVAEAEIDEVLDQYLERLTYEVAQSPHYVVHAGVRQTLARAERLGARCALGLGTGNLEQGAKIKLARGGLDRTFSFGGFGSDHERRSEVIRIGARRGAAQLGRDVSQCRVVVIGDTPEDVAAARAVGAVCVAVATGPYSVEQLRQAGATFACEDLQQSAADAAIFDDAS
jgi:phosphoglycolate phosphatase-like HAD superfamily hydrolase